MEDKKSVLRHSLVGFLKSRMEGVKVVESWLYNYWGKMAVRINLLDEKAVERSGGSALCDGWVFFPFMAIDRWTEVISSLPFPWWVRM